MAIPNRPSAKLAVLGLALLTGAPALAQQALPEVSTATIWVAAVERGGLDQEVRGPGTLERFGRGYHARARVAAPQAASVALDQVASVDTRADKLAGRVVHIGDRVEEGTLVVIVELSGELPESLRPGLSVDVRIAVDHLEDVLFVSRPAFGQANQTAGIFKLLDDSTAERIPVSWGEASVDKIVVSAGLEVGDRIILSDMSRYASVSRVRLVE